MQDWRTEPINVIDDISSVADTSIFDIFSSSCQQTLECTSARSYSLSNVLSQQAVAFQATEQN